MNNPYDAPSADMSVPESQAGTYQPRIFALTGRIGRLRYFAYAMLLTLLSLIPFYIFAAMQGGFVQANLNPMKYLWMAPSYAVGILLATRRLSDTGNSRWWAVLMAIPYVSVIPYLYLLFKPGDEEANEYGPPPCANTRGVVAAAWLLPAIALIGIVTAVTIPAYQAYSHRGSSSAGPGSKL